MHLSSALWNDMIDDAWHSAGTNSLNTHRAPAALSTDRGTAALRGTALVTPHRHLSFTILHLHLHPIPSHPISSMSRYHPISTLPDAQPRSPGPLRKGLQGNFGLIQGIGN